MKLIMMVCCALSLLVSCKPRLTSQSQSELNIYKGTPTSDFPTVGALSMVAITSNNDGNYFGGRTNYVALVHPFCTGTLIRKNVVITAEHCLPGGIKGFEREVRPQLAKWSAKNEGALATAFLFFTTNPNVLDKNDKKRKDKLHGPAMSIVEVELVDRFDSSGGIDEGKNSDGIILLRLSNEQFKKDMLLFDPSFAEKFELGEFDFPSYPVISPTEANPLIQISAASPNGFRFREDARLAMVGYGFDNSRGHHGQKLWSYATPKSIEDEFIHVTSKKPPCHGDSGGPLMSSAVAKIPNPNQPADEHTILGVLHGTPFTWATIFEGLSTLVYISDMDDTCSRFGSTADYMMPYLKKDKINAILKKWGAY